MPPLDWARLATPAADGEADGLALEVACDAVAVGEAVADGSGIAPMD